ncbi:UNVERIFIED_ORG: hypothetical protein J3D58_000598 [Paenarthrobacter nicotinovorans]
MSVTQPLHDQYGALQYDEEVTAELAFPREDFSRGCSPCGADTVQQFDLRLAQPRKGARDIRRFDWPRVCKRLHQLFAPVNFLDERLMGIAPAPVFAGLQGKNDGMQLGGVGPGMPHG